MNEHDPFDVDSIDYSHLQEAISRELFVSNIRERHNYVWRIYCNGRNQGLE